MLGVLSGTVAPAPRRRVSEAGLSVASGSVGICQDLVASVERGNYYLSNCSAQLLLPRIFQFSETIRTSPS